METCLKGFSNSFMPESVVEVTDLQYIEGGELERAWKSTRRQRLKLQEDKIWENFVKEQDILQSVCKDDPYQFLDELPETYLKELMNTELQKMKLERAEEVVKLHEQRKLVQLEEVRKEEHVQHTVTFAEANENDSEIFHVFNDEKNEDVSGPEDEVLDESLETPCTVREREDEGTAGEEGEGEGEKEKDTSPVRSGDKSSSKSSENVSNLIESSIYCAKVKELRIKINEEIYSIMASLEKQHVANVEPQQLRNMCKRSQEFCSRFQRIHMYQLQRQIRDIKRHNSLALPFAKHTQFQSQMVRIVSLHQNMLQSFQVIHKSFEQTLCLRESADMVKSLATVVRDACASCRGCCVPHVPAARDLFTEELYLTCDKLDESVNDYVAKVTDFVNATEASMTCSTRSRKSPKSKEKKKTILSTSKNASKTEADARLSMYSLATIRMGVGGKQQTNSGGASKGRTSRSKKGQVIQDAPKSQRKSSRCRRPLMRDPHSGQPRVRVPLPSDQEIRTMVEVVEPPSSHISREGSPQVDKKASRRRSTGPPTPRTPRVKALTLPRLSREESPRWEARTTPRTPRLKEMRLKPVSPLGSPGRRAQPRVATSAIRSETEDTDIEQISPVSKIQCAWKVKEAEVTAEEPPKEEPVPDRNEKEKPKTSDLHGCEVTRLLRQLCGGDTVGNRNERSSGAKNVQLLCVNGGSPRQPSTPQLLKILEESIQKKVPKSMYSKPSKSKDSDKLRLNFNIPDKTADNLFQYRTKFVQHMLTSSMYANSAVGKPWEMISSVAEQIIDDLLLANTKEMEIQNILQDLYDIETS